MGQFRWDVVSRRRYANTLEVSRSPYLILPQRMVAKTEVKMSKKLMSTRLKMAWNMTTTNISWDQKRLESSKWMNGWVVASPWCKSFLLPVDQSSCVLSDLTGHLMLTER